jgi:hypothetical protein
MSNEILSAPNVKSSEGRKEASRHSQIDPAPKFLPDPEDTPPDFAQVKPVDAADLNSAHRHRHEISYSHVAGPKGGFAVSYTP